MALVRIDGVNFTYAGAKRQALTDASLEINEGEYVLLTGAYPRGYAGGQHNIRWSGDREPQHKARRGGDRLCSAEPR